MSPIIIEDTREQAPLYITQFPVFRGGIQFQPGEPRPSSEDFPYPKKGLPVGDYGVDGFSDWTNPAFIVERKSISDLCGSLGKGHARFWRLVEKMRQFRFRALIIEGDTEDIDQNYRERLARYDDRLRKFKAPGGAGKKPGNPITPASIFGQLDALMVRTNLHVLWCGDPAGAARKVENLVEKFARGIEKDWKLLEG